VRVWERARTTRFCPAWPPRPGSQPGRGLPIGFACWTGPATISESWSVFFGAAAIARTDPPSSLTPYAPAKRFVDRVTSRPVSEFHRRIMCLDHIDRDARRRMNIDRLEQSHAVPDPNDRGRSPATTGASLLGPPSHLPGVCGFLHHGRAQQGFPQRSRSHRCHTSPGCSEPVTATAPCLVCTTPNHLVRPPLWRLVCREALVVLSAVANGVGYIRILRGP
jgi:hypothetical protein